MASIAASTDYGNWVPTRLIVIPAVLGILFAALALLLPLPLLAVLVVLCFACSLYFAYARQRFAPKGGDIQSKVRDLLLERVTGWDGKGKALDIGCGNGAVAIELAKRYPRAEVVGIDYWGPSWEYSQNACAANAKAEGVADRVAFQRASASSLPFEDGSFAAVVSNMTFHEVRDTADKREVVREAFRVLRKGGVFAFQDVFLWKAVYGEIDELLGAIRSWGVDEIAFVNTSEADCCPKALRLPFMLGRIAVVYGRK